MTLLHALGERVVPGAAKSFRGGKLRVDRSALADICLGRNPSVTAAEDGTRPTPSRGSGRTSRVGRGWSPRPGPSPWMRCCTVCAGISTCAATAWSVRPATRRRSMQVPGTSIVWRGSPYGRARSHAASTSAWATLASPPQDEAGGDPRRRSPAAEASPSRLRSAALWAVASSFVGLLPRDRHRSVFTTSGRMGDRRPHAHRARHRRPGGCDPDPRQPRRSGDANRSRGPGRIQSIVATPACWSDRSCSLSASAGVFQPSVLRGRLLTASATAWISSRLHLDRSVPLGKYWRNSPFVFSLVPRCQGLWGSAK